MRDRSTPTRRDIVAGLASAATLMPHEALGQLSARSRQPDDFLSTTLSSDWVDVKAPPGTRVAEINGRIFGRAIRLDSVTFQTGGDIGGRFTIVQEEERFYLHVGTGALVDFEGEVRPRPLMFYFPAVRWSRGPFSANATLTLRPRYPKVEPAGGTLNQTILVSSMDALYKEVVRTHPNKTVKIDPAWKGIGKPRPGVRSQPRLNRSNCTYEGHPEWAMRHGRGWIFRQGSNIIVRDWAFRVGTHLVNTGFPALNEVDNLMVAFQGTNWLRDIVFQNCSFSSSNDELISIKNGGSGFAARGVRFTNCLFAEPLYDAGHPKGREHNLGPAVSPNHANVVFDHCLMLGSASRSPLISKSLGATIRNCVIGHWRAHKDYGGTICVLDSTNGPSQITARIEGCLYQKPVESGLWPARQSAVVLRGLTDVNTAFVHIPSIGDYRNYHIDIPTDGFGDDPLALRDGIHLDRGTIPDVIRATPPFELADDYELMPTATEADRRALLARVLDWVGVRRRDDAGNLIPGDLALNHYDYDIVNAFRTAGIARTDITPAQLAFLYGLEWDGAGGSLGHGMTDVPAG